MLTIITQAAIASHHLDTYVRRFMHATPFTAHSQRYYNQAHVLVACKYYRRPEFFHNQMVQSRELTRIARHLTRLVATYKGVYKRRMINTKLRWPRLVLVDQTQGYPFPVSQL
jgi:hypothetical protein